MPKKRTIGAGAINLRLDPHPPGIYKKFFETLKERHFVSKIRGETHAAITHLDEPDGDILTGIFARFAKIDADGYWFDAERF
ncbi:MAG: hypothetical protein ACOC05_02055, partial [Oceanicaulis sp.]